MSAAVETDLANAVRFTDAHLYHMARRLSASLLHRMRPPKRLSMSEWAAQSLYLSKEEGPEPGLWRAERAPFQAGIMDAISDPMTEEVTVMSSSQIGKTTIAKAVVGFFMEIDPSPMLYVQSTLEMAESFSKDRLAPMLRDCPSLQGLIDDKSRDSGNTLLHKQFPGGHLTMAGSNSPASLASRPIRVLILDEKDRYPASAGNEGDPSNLAIARTSNFWNRKILNISSPGVKVLSRIHKDFEAGSQAYLHVPCPHCGEGHRLEFVNLIIDRDNPEASQLCCPNCGGMYGEAERAQMMQRCHWVHTYPERKRKSFHVSQLYSPWVRLGTIAQKWLDAQDKPEELKTFYNTVLGLPYEEAGDSSDDKQLLARRENYGIHALPSGILLLVAGVDVQADRLECEVIGLGAGEECWGVQPVVFLGDPAQSEVWQRLDDFLLRDWATEDGRTLRIRAACVDSGDGNRTQAVYTYCQPRAGRNVWAIKGMPGSRPIWPIRASKSSKYRGFAVRAIGVDTAKDLLHARCRVGLQDGQFVGGAGSLHWHAGYDEEWFAQFTAERLITTVDKKGRMVRAWVKEGKRRNEALDCRVYAWAAYQGLVAERGLSLDVLALAARELPLRLVDTVADAPQTEPPVDAVVTPQPMPAPRETVPPPWMATQPQRRVVRSGYLR